MSSSTRCPSEPQWDRFVLDPSIPEHDELARHLAGCPYCAMLVADLKREWATIEAGENSALQFQGPIEVTIVSELWSDSAQPALAAMGQTGPKEPESVTMASPDRVVWLRAVRDPRTRDLWLYLYSEEDQAIARHAIVRPFGLDREFLTDDQGRINLGKTEWPQRESLKADVRLPKAEFNLTPLHPPAGESTELTSPGGDRISLSWTGERTNRRLEIGIAFLRDLIPGAPIKIAVRSSGQLEPVIIRTIPPTGKASFEGIDDPEGLEIYIYQ